MNKSHKMVRKVSSALIFIAAVMTAPQAFAETATLNGVEISSANSRGYDIVLNTENAPEIQKKASASDTIILDLKNTKVSKDTNTVYKNANGIEHVILKPEANNVQIEISGEAAGASNVSVNNILASAPNYENTVFVNKPLNAYAPIHQIEEEAATTSVSVMSILSKIKNSPTLRSIVNSSNLGWIVSFVLMFGFLIWTNMRSQKRSEVNVKIGGAENENKVVKAAIDRMNTLGSEGVGTASRRTALRPKPKDGLSVQQTNYGLKSYENQNANASTSSFKIQNSPMQKDVLSSATASARRPMRESTATAQELRESTKRNEVHIDNVKFLESMARIYERSGRVDLANGLNNNIKKAKNNIIR